MSTTSVEYQTSADRRSEFDACDVHLCQHFEKHCWSLAPSTANITAPPADAHRRSLGTHRSLPQKSFAIGPNTASRRTHTHTLFLQEPFNILPSIPWFSTWPLSFKTTYQHARYFLSPIRATYLDVILRHNNIC